MDIDTDLKYEHLTPPINKLCYTYIAGTFLYLCYNMRTLGTNYLSLFSFSSLSFSLLINKF